MTGFGSAKEENDIVRINVQIKSVNGRFLETRFRMPREYSALETELKKILSQKFHRGTVDINVSRMAKALTKPVSVTVNTELARSWVSALHELADKFKLSSNISVETLSKIPEIIQFAEMDELSESEKNLLLKVTHDALDACLGEREREGGEQVQTFTHLLNDLEKFISSVKGKKDHLSQELKSKLEERIQTLSDQTVDPNRLAQEVLFLLDRADIAEEIDRALAHISAFRKALKGPTPVGKKLEFYTQELHREINTMGSKTQNLSVALDIIEAKTIIERMREQAQNVE